MCQKLRPTLDDLKRVWLHAYARTSLIEADTWLSGMNNRGLDSEQKASFVCSALIAYARPFTRWQITPTERVLPLATVPVPLKLLETHEMALSLRNKALGHKDATPAKGHTETPNVVVLNFDGKGFDIHTVRVYDMDEETQLTLRKLCAHFIEHCDVQLDEFVKKYGFELMKLTRGAYRLLLSESPSPWIESFNPESI